jgi:polysaccharide pyruvyl transferase WcaK-like protein
METDYVVASRLHGIILSHIANKPVLGISYDRKVNTYMSEMDQMEYCVDIHSVEIDSLINTYKKMVENENNIREHIRNKVLKNLQSLEFQYGKILIL